MTERVNRRRALRLGAATLAVSALGAAAYSSAQALPPPRPALGSGSRLDPGQIQILFADLQVPLVAGSTTMPPSDLSRAAAVLAKVATVLDMPMLFSVVPEGSAPPHLIPELLPFSTPANTILRTRISPFHDAQTVAALARTGRRTLVIAGFAVEAVVVQAALDALAAGYSAFYVSDAVGSQSARTEAAIFRAMDEAGAIPTSVLSLSRRLIPDLIGSPGAETFAALQPLLSSRR